MLRGCESNIIFLCMHPSMRQLALICQSCYHRVEFNQTCYITSPHGKGVREQHHFSACPSVRASIYLSIMLSPPKPLSGIQPNLTSPHGKGLQEHYFSMHPSFHVSIHLSITLSLPKPLGGIPPNFLHHLPSW